jgi:hypothetical protein
MTFVAAMLNCRAPLLALAPEPPHALTLRRIYFIAGHLGLTGDDRQDVVRYADRMLREGKTAHEATQAARSYAAQLIERIPA